MSTTPVIEVDRVRIPEPVAPLSSLIRFTVPEPALTSPPLSARRSADGFVIESFGVQRDLTTLLMWAEDHGVELRDLTAGPTGPDEVYRAAS